MSSKQAKPCPVCGYTKVSILNFCERCGINRNIIKKRYTIADLRAKCKKLKLELDADTKYNVEYAIYTPRGYRFAATGTHVIVSPHRGDKKWKIEAVNNLMEDLSHGLEKCPNGCECMED